jgi:nitroreductase
MDFSGVVRRRRMVRHFADEPVDRAILERIAATAQHAPSAGFSQGQRLLVVTEPTLRRRIGLLCGEDSYTDAGFDPWISQSAALFIPCGTEINWPVPYWWMDIGCTVMLVLLAAVNEGLAAGFAGSDAAGYVEMCSFLGIPADFAPVGVIPVGRALPDKRSESLKRGWVPNPQFARWNGWEVEASDGTN